MAITYYKNAAGQDVIDKDPQAVLDYKFDWNAADRDGNKWLATGETISTRTVTVAGGITKDSDSITDSGKSVTVWLSGGTAGSAYLITCQIVTSAGRTDERSFLANVVQR